MDISAILNTDGYHTPNPAYKKGNGQPKFLITSDPNYAPSTSADMFFEAAKRGDLEKIGNLEDYKKYIEYGITPRKGDSFDDYQRNLADYQGFMEKARNSFVQTLSEGSIGTVKAFADLFDLVTLAQLRNDSDYQNPISSQLEEWQNKIRDNFTIWQDPDKNVLNGGLLDSGFIFNGLPSVISSLTLLIPSKAVTFGLTKGLGYITKKGIKFARNIEKAHRANKLGETAETAARAATEVNGTSKVAALNAYLHGPTGERVKNIIDYGIGGLTSRLLENYQEGRQTFNDSKPVYNEILKNMSPEERQKTINNLKAEYGEDAADWKSYDSISSLVARKAADETFKDDMANVMFDIYQMYTIGKVARGINGPSRAALRRLNKNNIKYAGKTTDEINKILENRTKFQKFKDKTSDILIGGKNSIIAEATEGIEEAVNYIAQEEGFHYGKVLLNQESEQNTFTDRLVNYMKAPALWDSAFWGLAGGVIFNEAGEYANRVTQAIDKINEKKAESKRQVSEGKEAVKIPTFWEAFKSTELIVREANLRSNVSKYNSVKETINKIEDGKDIYGLTTDGILKTDEEKNASKEIAIRNFRDEVILDAMDSGNFDLAKEYLSSDELKQVFVDSGQLTKEQADKIQTDILSRGDELNKEYTKQLRLIYNAVADWGEYNEADLTEIPFEVFNIIARENISNTLTAQYYNERLNRLNTSTNQLEDDSKTDLDKAAKENGITDFRSIVDRVWKAQQLGVLQSQIEFEKANKTHTLESGQSIIRNLEEKKKVLEDDLLKYAFDENGNPTVEGTAYALAAISSSLAVETEAIGEGKNKTYSHKINTGNKKYSKMLDAINNADSEIMKNLSPVIKTILDKTKPNDTKAFVEQVKNRYDVLNQTITNIYDKDTGKLKILDNINKELPKNYEEIAAVSVAKLFAESNIKSTKSQILARANDILNQLNNGARAVALETSFHLYQQLAKRYGKDDVLNEILTYVKTNNHTPVYEKFNDDEKSLFDSYITLSKLNNPEQDIIIKDIVSALNHNDIYEYSKEQDVLEDYRKIKEEAKQKETQKNSTSQNSSQSNENESVNNQSQEVSKDDTSKANGQIDEITPLEDDEIGEGVIDINDDDNNETKDNNNPFSSENLKQLDDSQLDTAINEINNIINDTTIPEEVKVNYKEKLNILEKEKENRAQSQISSTGEQTQNIDNELQSLDKSDVVSAIVNVVENLAKNNSNNIDEDGVKEQVISAIKSNFTNVSEEDIKDLVEAAMPLANKKIKRKTNKSIEALLADSVIKLSTISSKTTSDKVISEARAIIDKSFDKLLDIFNKNLSKGKINGKYIIPLESLIRYVRQITKNEYEAKEMYNAFSKIITENPNKYKVINGEVVTPSKVIQNIIQPIQDREKVLEKSIGGRTLDIKTILNNIEDEKEKDKILETIKALRPGDKIYVRPNYDNEKWGDKDVHKLFIGGIDFIVKKADGEEVLISKLPTPSFGVGGKNYYTSALDGWFYSFPLSEDSVLKEYPIQIFFKKLFTDKKANAFIDKLTEYEALTGQEANDKNVGGKLLKEAYDELINYANAINVDLSVIIQKGKTSKTDNENRIKHLAKLHIYVENNLYNELEKARYKKQSKSVIDAIYAKSVDTWFNKLIESSNVRNSITESLEDLEKSTNKDKTKLYDVGIEIESVGKPVLVITKEENALPATKAIADQHKNDIHLAAGDPNNSSQVVVSNGQPISLGGHNTIGRSVVAITSPNGETDYINAYPVKFNNPIFENNVKLKAFKEALSIKLFELMDKWYANTEEGELALIEFLESLGHNIDGNKNNRSSLFTGLSVKRLKNGNGFSIAYKMSKDEIVSPSITDTEETHYLTFYSKVGVKNDNNKTKARAAVQDYVKGEDNKAVVWKTDTKNSEVAATINSVKQLIEKVVLDSLKVRIDPSNITADNNSQMGYGSFMTRDSNGNLALKVTDIKNPSNSLKEYYDKNTGSITITNLGRNGNAGNFSDFIIFNDLVNLTTRPINGSNFSIFDNSNGDFGITYTKRENIAKIVTDKEQQVIKINKLSDIVKTKLNNLRKNENGSKAIIKLINDVIKQDNISLNKLLSNNNTLLRRLLHKNVIFVENFVGATYKENIDGKLVERTIPDNYAAYIPSDMEFTIDGKVVKVKGGSIVISNEFMNLLDGNTDSLIDAVHQIIHENVHAFIADNNLDKDINNKYKKEINDLWDEYTKAYPKSNHAKTDDYNEIEEFIVESLTNIDLIKELNNKKAEEPLNGPNKPKSLLGKLLNSLINWLSDILGKDFSINPDSLLSKEYAIFEDAISEQDNNSKNIKETDKKIIINDEKTDNNEKEFVVKTTKQEEEKKGIDNIKIPTTEKSSRRNRPSVELSTIKMNFNTIDGVLQNMTGEEYFDTIDKINNGIISIKCN